MSIPKRFEHYEVLERGDGSLWELGRGAMGVTYKAIDTDLHCPVALKVINPAILNAAGTAQRFLREARAAAQLRHPNIATVLRLGKTEDGTHFYAMEFCEGDTLEQLVANGGPLKVETALEFTLQVAKALVAAEEHQVVHRDIKPSNLIVGQRRDEGSVVKVIDFGLAKSVAGAGNAWSSMTLATAGFIGTAHFSSPEQLEEGEVDVRSDIYSLGATLWFMLTGEPMFSGSMARVMSQHLSSPPPWEQLDSLGLPDAAHQLLATMLAKNAKDRPQSAIELKQKIQFCLQDDRGDTTKHQHSTIAQTADSKSLLNGRWKLLENLGAGIVGKLYRGIDLTEKDRAVAVRFLDPQLCGNRASWSQLERAVQLLKGAPAGVVRPIHLDRDHKNRPFLVSEQVTGMPLATLLRRRGALTLKEILHLLKNLAPAFDYAVEHRVECAPFSKTQVLLSLPTQAPTEEQFDELMQKPLTEWPDVCAMIDLSPMDTNDSLANETFSSMQTVLPGGALASSGQVPRLPTLGILVYELLGGAPRTTGRYVPIARLSPEGNDFLKHILDSNDNPAQFLTGAQFLDRLTQTAGFEPTWKPDAVVEPERHKSRLNKRPQSKTPNDHRGIIRSYPIPFAIAVFALTIGLFWLILGRSVEEPKRPLQADERRPKTRTQDDSITPTMPPPVAAPRLELSGTLVSTANSPKGDIRVEHRSGGHIYLIDRSDEAKRFTFPASSAAVTEVLFSPDENWLVLNQTPYRKDGSSQLYHRVRPEDVEYTPAEITPGESLTDSIWRFYLKEVDLPSTTSRSDVGVNATEWSSDSTAVRFRLDSFAPEARKSVPRVYECDYDPDAQRFHSITDTGSIRDAIASASQPSHTIVPPAPAPVIEETPVPPLPVVTLPAGRYPETGTRLLTEAELQNWPADQLRYAINEIFARHGAVFPDQKIQKEFQTFAWYHAQRSLTFAQIEQSLPEIERQNVQLLGNVRDAKKIALRNTPAPSREQVPIPVPLAPVQAVKLFAGTWAGTVHNGGEAQGVALKGADQSFTIEIEDTESSLSIRDNGSPRHSQFSVTRSGRSLSWKETTMQDTTAGPEPKETSGTFTVLPNGTVAHFNELEEMSLQGRGRVKGVQWGTFKKTK
jgi:serine/threonine protein kinase